MSQMRWTEAACAALCYLWQDVRGMDDIERCYWCARHLGLGIGQVRGAAERIGLMGGRRDGPHGRGNGNYNLPRFTFIPADRLG